jgi:hypothetical protein
MTDFGLPTGAGAVRLREIAAGLTAIGLLARLHRTRSGTDLTATLHPPGHRDVEVIVDEDGYTELRYWANLSTTPTTAVTTIARALAAITAPRSLANAAGQAGEPVAGYDGAVTERAEGSGMPGPQDHLAEQGRVPDQSRPRAADDPHETRVRPDDLQARLERLPTNHPSSPYRDDSSRKPPPPDLSQYELPLPDEPNSTTDRDLSPAEQPRTAPDGSWDWKGHKLNPERSFIADQAIAARRDKEGRDLNGNYGDQGLTPAMRRIEAQLDHGHLVDDTEKYALKDPDRFKEKFAKLIERYPGVDPRELAAGIHDGIRYTFILDFDHYTETVEVGHSRLADTGYERIETKPSWDSDEYKGVNSQWREPSAGVMFEVQFHTQESWEAKQKTHAAYEKIKTPGTSIEEVEWLRAYQRHVSAEVRVPLGALEIRPYKKEL